MKECLNCHQNITEDAKFCSHCGQKNRPGKLTLWEFFKIFFDTYFNLDSTIFRTVRDLFIPGRLTVKFFEGKRKSYLHPLRTFLLTSAFFIGIVGANINGFLSEKAEELSSTVNEFFVKEKTLMQVDSIQKQFYGENPHCYTINIQDSLRQLYTSNILDSIRQNIELSIDSPEGKLDDLKIEELYSKSAEQLIKEYEITSWRGEIAIKQFTQFLKNPTAFIRATIGNLIWMVLLLMPVIALFLKLIYIRHGYFFVEHLVFSFHFNSFAFLTMGLTLWISDANIKAILLTNLVIIVFLIVAMKKYYQQSKRKTFLKWLLLLWGYLLAMSFFFSILLGLSFLLF